MSVDINGDKVTYLGFIQNAIARMSTYSAIFKGFAATLTATVSSLSFKGIGMYVMLLSYLPLLFFVLLDAYYLKNERIYRFLYDKVRLNDSREVDFNMDIAKISMSRDDIKKYGMDIWHCLTSQSVYLFYIPLGIICVIIIILKYNEV